MKDWEYNVMLFLSVGCLILAVWIIGSGRSNERLQAKLQVQQVDIERGNVSRQIGNRIVQDMVASGSTNKAMQTLLGKYGLVPRASSVPVSIKSEKQIVSPTKIKDKNVKHTAGK